MVGRAWSVPPENDDCYRHSLLLEEFDDPLYCFPVLLEAVLKVWQPHLHYPPCFLDWSVSRKRQRANWRFRLTSRLQEIATVRLAI